MTKQRISVQDSQKESLKLIEKMEEIVSLLEEKKSVISSCSLAETPDCKIEIKRLEAEIESKKNFIEKFRNRMATLQDVGR